MIVRVLVGWAVASGLFLLGWLTGVATHRRACEEALVQYARRVEHLEQVNADLKEKLDGAFEFGRLIEREATDP